MGLDLYTPQTLAQTLAVSPASIRKWIKDPVNPLPFLKLGKLLRFDPARVEAWLISKERCKAKSSLEYYAKLPKPSNNKSGER